VSFAFAVIIPSRYSASRLPGKPLLDIGGESLIQHVYRAARKSQAKEVIVATDDDRIEDAVRSFGAEVIMTDRKHASGTDRIAEVARIKKFADDMIVVNVQGDEYGLPEAQIDQLAQALNNNPHKPMATLCEKIESREDMQNPNIVKVVRDINDTAIYFSRSPIPWVENETEQYENNSVVYRHIGIYAYRTAFLKQFSELPVCAIEKSERLEQLRALYNGFKIHVEEACVSGGIGIDTEDDLQRARALHGSG
jgi:3-deoxy-manno-octulosonate cytidylyltransferase (CMP-KDO synthetase)